MNKWLLLSLFIVVQTLFGANFTEKRYIYALDRTTIFKGTITLSDDSTIVQYSSPEKKILTQKGTILTIEEVEKNKTQVIDLSKRIDMNLYFSFMRSIHNKDFSGLATYFNISKEKNTYHLFPKDQVKRMIEKMEITVRKGDEMQKMVISFTNGDIIEIEAL